MLGMCPQCEKLGDKNLKELTVCALCGLQHCQVHKVAKPLVFPNFNEALSVTGNPKSKTEYFLYYQNKDGHPCLQYRKLKVDHGEKAIEYYYYNRGLTGWLRRQRDVMTKVKNC
jgi:hypothetical protein